MIMKDKVYDTIRFLAEVLLPAAGTLYFAIAGIWNLPYGEQIVGTITAVDCFLGALIGISRSKFNATKN